jgi:glutathione synthase/RimK-type ligase-like ATP-grasp enzyme
MSPPRLALVTAAAARDLDEDLPPLLEALRAHGAEVQTPNWDDAAVDWSDFDLALLRSTWDYTQRVAEFLAWTDRAAQATRLANPAEIVSWNTDKHYLAVLERAGVPIVPGAFIEPGADAAAQLADFLQAHDSAEFVVKPAIGAGSRDAQRYGRHDCDAALGHAQRLLGEQRSVLLQPYLDRVDEHGETALIYFGGRFSHAIRKGPLLRKGEGATRALFATEHITPRTPAAAEFAVAEKTLAAMPFAQPLLYARVDLIHDASGAPRVLELELTEPSLFFAHSEGSAARFAAAILKSL